MWLYVSLPPPRSHPAAGSRAFIHTLEGSTQRPLARLRLGCSVPGRLRRPRKLRLRGCCAVAVNALRVYQDGGEEEQMDAGRAADLLRWW